MSSSSIRSAIADATRAPDRPGAHGLGRLSRADAHAGPIAPCRRWRARNSSPGIAYLPVGGLARGAAKAARCRSHAGAERLGGKAEPSRPDARLPRATGCGSISTRRIGTRSACSTATSCFTRRGWSRKRCATAARRLRRGGKLPALGQPMRFDHRRILATAIARLRAKLKYRPVIFELLAEEFTLTELQRTVEAISGRHLHKQNFRRLVEAGALVEPTGEVSTATGDGRRRCFRFRREVLQERPAPGLRVRGRR